MQNQKFSMPNSELYVTEKKIPKDEVYSMHWHDYIELELIISGQAEHIYNSDAYKLSVGDAYIVTHRDLHAFRAISDVRLFNIGFDIKVLDEELSRALMLSEGKRLCCSFDDIRTSDMMEICTLMLREQSGGDEYSEQMKRALLSRLIIEILRRSEHGRLMGRPLSKKALEYIHIHFKEELSLSMLAEKMNVTPNYMGRLFREETGESFSSYINSIRIRNACNMLMYSNVPIKEISEMSGYMSNEYFFSVFKKKVGMTPAEYRNNSFRKLQKGEM